MEVLWLLQEGVLGCWGVPGLDLSHYRNLYRTSLWQDISTTESAKHHAGWTASALEVSFDIGRLSICRCRKEWSLSQTELRGQDKLKKDAPKFRKPAGC